MSLTIKFDLNGLLQANMNLAESLEGKMEAAIESLSIQAHAHIVQLASQRLKTTKNDFVNALVGPSRVDNDTWSIAIPSNMLWIEDGIQPGFDMIPGMMKSPKAKTGPNGKYLVIPFKHNKAPSKRTPLQQQLFSQLSNALKKVGKSATKLEKNPDGSHKIGQLYKFNINSPTRKHDLPPGVSGPVSHSLTAHPRPQGQSGPSGRPYLWNGIMTQKKNDKGVVQKDAMTFRTASESQRGKAWIHPGFKALNSIQQTADWAESEWKSKILPELMKDAEG